MTEHIVAVFRDAAAADAAERALLDAGIPSTAISRYTGSSISPGSDQPVTQADRPEQSAEPSGFWARLLGEGTTSYATPSADYGWEFEH